ncbi:MAG TPA: hypothetical protein VN181_04655 [Thermoanaerobaculia bacterium]|nr:hypothetical protein [Thermoanaerobaculia bacterium]
MTVDLADPAVSRLVVTGHPNHELAIFGFVQRMRPRLLFLTDGGGEERVNESRRALAAIGLLDRATFLNHREQTLYDALLATDIAMLRRLVADVRRELIAHAVRQVICESIELYNPLHDITLPIVRAAAARLDIELVEFALIAQEPAADERYRVQRFAADARTTSIELNAIELATKLHARDQRYPALRRTMAAVLDAVGDDDCATEHFRPAATELPTPGVDHVLRYEWRAHLLRERGEIAHVITFADHFLRAVEGVRS